MFSKQDILSGLTQAHLFSPSLNPKSLKQAALLFKVQWVETLLVSWLGVDTYEHRSATYWLAKLPTHFPMH